MEKLKLREMLRGGNKMVITITTRPTATSQNQAGGNPGVWEETADQQWRKVGRKESGLKYLDGQSRSASE